MLKHVQPLWEILPIVQLEEIMLFAFAIDDGPVKVWDCTTGEKAPEELRRAPMWLPEIPLDCEALIGDHL